MARSPLFAALRWTVRLARMADRRGMPPVDELVELHRERGWSRRRFLKTSMAGALAAGAAASGGCSLWRGAPRTRGGPRVVIVGGGLAGLNAAYRLERAGIGADVYEAGDRIGGRVFTATDLLGRGLTTELGGEFIDSTHLDMLSLAREFNLQLIDTQAASERDLIPEAYFFDGRHYSESEVVQAFRPVMARMRLDFDSIGDAVDDRVRGGAAEFLDNTSLEEYLDRAGANGFLKELLVTAYVTEYGLDAGEQSALNLLMLIGLDAERDAFEVFGDSDERYKIRGGNQQIVDALAGEVRHGIHHGHRLESLAARGSGFALTFSRGVGSPRTVEADIVLLAMPFSLLRQVELSVELPEVKRRAIAELGYGTNAKVMVGISDPVWRAHGYSGNVLSEEDFQLAWDNGRQQGSGAGPTGLTLYSGGHRGVAVGRGTPREQADRLMPGVERVFPGVGSERSGAVARFHWPSHPLALGSYACYRPGQWTSIGGAEFVPVGNLHFAGEHCSSDFQGYMNGAAETGRRAAEAMRAAVRA